MVQDSLQVHALSNALRPLFQSGRIWKALIQPYSFVSVKFSSNFLLSYEIFLSCFHNDVWIWFKNVWIIILPAPVLKSWVNALSHYKPGVVMNQMTQSHILFFNANLIFCSIIWSWSCVVCLNSAVSKSKNKNS